jgi:hypothetical protein
MVIPINKQPNEKGMRSLRALFNTDEKILLRGMNKRSLVQYCKEFSVKTWYFQVLPNNPLRKECGLLIRALFAAEKKIFFQT